MYLYIDSEQNILFFFVQLDCQSLNKQEDKKRLKKLFLGKKHAVEPWKKTTLKVKNTLCMKCKS